MSLSSLFALPRPNPRKKSKKSTKRRGRKTGARKRPAKRGRARKNPSLASLFGRAPKRRAAKRRTARRNPRAGAHSAVGGTAHLGARVSRLEVAVKKIEKKNVKRDRDIGAVLGLMRNKFSATRRKNERAFNFSDEESRLASQYS